MRDLVGLGNIGDFVHYMDAIFTLFRYGITELPRRKQFHAKRIACALLAGLVVLWSFGTAVYDGQHVEGLKIFTRLGYLALLAAGIIPPLVTATVFAREREDRTLGLLLMTDMSPSRLVIGRLLAGLWVSILALMSVLPMLLLCISLSGVHAQQVIYVLALTGTQIVLGASIGLYASIRMPTQRQSTFVALTVAAIVNWGIPVMVAFGAGVLPLRNWEQWIGTHLLPVLSPWYAFDGMLADTTASPLLAWAYVPLALAISAILALMTIRRLPLGVDELAGIARPVVSLGLGDWRPALASLPRRRFKPKRDDDNPLVWKEQPQSLWPLWAWSLLAVALVAGPWGYVTGSLGYVIPLSIYVASALIFSFGVIVRSSMAFTAELSNRTLDLLLLSGMTEEDIIMGKYWGYIRGYSPWLLSMGASLLILGQGERFTSMAIGANLFVVLTFAYSQLGMLLSLMARRTLAIMVSLTCFTFWAAFIPTLISNLYLAVGIGGLHLGIGLYLMHRLYKYFRPLALGTLP